MNKELKQLDIDELNQLSEQIEQDPEKAATMLFPDKPSECVMLAKKIGQWAINQTLVIENSQHNKTDIAMLFNKVGDRIWHQLPTYARNVRIYIE